MNRLKAMVRLSTAILFMLVLTVDVVSAERPEECADEDRIQVGSRLDWVCKWDLNLSDITHAELLVEEIEYDNVPYCQLVYRFYGVSYGHDFESIVNSEVTGSIDAYDRPPPWEYRGSLWSVRYQSYQPGGRPTWKSWDLWDSYFSGGSDNFIDFRSRVLWDVSENVTLGTDATEYTLMQLGLVHFDSWGEARESSAYYIDIISPQIATPANFRLSSWGLQVNSCLDNIQSRLDAEAEMRRIEEERIAQRARLEAEAAIAERKAAEEAAAAEAEAEAVRIEAESQANIEAIKLASAKELERKAQETELARTEALKASFERKKAIDAILANIIRIRLAGIEERRALTGAFLEEQVAASQELRAEVAQYEARIAEYDTFNRMLLDHLDDHRELMDEKIKEAQETSEEERRRLDELYDVAEPTSTSMIIEVEQPTPTRPLLTDQFKVFLGELGYEFQLVEPGFWVGESFVEGVSTSLLESSQGWLHAVSVRFPLGSEPPLEVHLLSPLIDESLDPSWITEVFYSGPEVKWGLFSTPFVTIVVYRFTDENQVVYTTVDFEIHGNDASTLQ